MLGPELGWVVGLVEGVLTGVSVLDVDGALVEAVLGLIDERSEGGVDKTVEGPYVGAGEGP